MVGVTKTATASPAAFAQLDWTRTLLTPLRRAAWRAYLYFLLVSVLAIVGVVFVFCTGRASALLIVTLVGIPLLALVVMSGRAWNRLYRSLARLLDSRLTLRRRSSGLLAGCRP
jgi:Putative sensor